MEGKRDYKRRGTLDFPVASYTMNRDGNYSHSPKWHPDVEIYLLYKGQGVIHLGSNDIPLQAGCIYFIHPNEVHSLHTTGPARSRTLVFSKDAIALGHHHFFQKEFVEPLWDGRLRLPQVLTPEHPAYGAAFAQMDALGDSYMYAPNYKAKRLAIVMSICTALLPWCSLDETLPVIPDIPNASVRKCLIYLHNHYRHTVTLEGIAKELNLNPNYLCTVFQKYTGESIFSRLTRIRIEHSTRLLQTTDLPVSKIAALSGYHSDCLFYRKFKEITGMTPLAYRKQQTHTED